MKLFEDVLNPMRKKVAFVCLAPAPGHVLPLIRIAETLDSDKYINRFFVPSEVARIPVASAFETSAFGYIQPAVGRELIAAAANSRSVFQRRIRNQSLHRRYYTPMQIAVLERWDLITRSLREFGPEMIIGDDHMFGTEMSALGDELEVPVLLHQAMGSLHPWQKGVFGKTGISRVSIAMQRFCADRYIGIRRRLKRKLRRNSEGVAHIEHLHQIRKAIGTREREERGRVTHFSTGTGLMEMRHLGKKLCSNRSVKQFGALQPILSGQLDDELQSWLAMDDARPVVYVSFGTMIRVRQKIRLALMDAAVAAGVRLVWASPEPPWIGYENRPNEFIYWSRWLPQPDVLSSPQVRAFVTHGGSGAIQEALWFSRPTLIIPHLWDQTYNAWVATELGYGLECRPSKANARRLTTALLRLCNDDQLYKRVQFMSHEIIAEDGRRSVLKLVEASLTV